MGGKQGKTVWRLASWSLYIACRKLITAYNTFFLLPNFKPDNKILNPLPNVACKSAL